MFSYYVTILIVSLGLLCTPFIQNKVSAEVEKAEEKESASDEIVYPPAEKDKKEGTKTESVPQEYEVYPISVPRTELPEDVHIVESNLNLTHSKIAGFPSAPGINIVIKKGNMIFNLNIDPTYSDLFFDINLKDIGVEEAKFPKELKQEAVPEENKEEKEKTAQQERLLNKIDEMMKALEKGKKAEGEIKEKEKEKILTKRQMENKILDHIDKSQRFFYKKKYGLALNEIQESLKGGDTALAYALEGTIYLALDDTTSAVASWKKALELNPNMKEVKDILEFYESEE